MTFTATSFWYQAALNAVGPLVTAIAVTLLAGLLVNFITRASQDRRAENQLRYELISQIIETASTLYHHITLYMRARAKTDAESADSARDNGADSREPDQLKNKLWEEYPVSRARAEVIQARLKIYFQEPRVEVAWHAVRDCLRVLYDNAISESEAPPEHISRYSKEGEKYHTGLSVDQLADPRIVSEAYGLHLKATAELCLRLSAKAASSLKASKPGH